MNRIGTHGSGNFDISSTGFVESGVPVAATSGEVGTDGTALLAPMLIASKTSGEPGRGALFSYFFILDSRNDLKTLEFRGGETARNNALQL